MARFTERLNRARGLGMEELGEVLARAKGALEENLGDRYTFNISTVGQNSNTLPRLAGTRKELADLGELGDLTAILDNRKQRVRKLESRNPNEVQFRPGRTYEDDAILKAAELGLIDPAFLNEMGASGLKWPEWSALSTEDMINKFKQNVIDTGSGRDVLTGGSIVNLGLDGGHILPRHMHEGIAGDPNNIRPEYASDNRALGTKEGQDLLDYTKKLHRQAEQDRQLQLAARQILSNLG